MPANAKITSASWVDTVAGNMIPYFETKAAGAKASFQSGPHWQCNVCTLRLGSQPSSATIRIPLAAAQDEVAPSVACVSGPYDGIKIGTRCAVQGYARVVEGATDPGVLLLVGSVVDISMDINKDEMVVEVLDDRYLLEGLQVIGSFWRDMVSGALVYRQGWPAHFNPRGMPNCTFSTAGSAGSYMPTFCTPNLGLADGEAVPGSGDGDVIDGNKATYWTTDLILQYLRFIFSSDVSSKVSEFEWYPQLPSSITWEANWASGIESGDKQQANAAQNSAQELSGRKGREMVLEGMTLLAALQEVLSACGPYALWLQPGSVKSADGLSFKNTVQMTNTRYKGSGLSLARASSGLASDVFAKQLVVTAGNYKESGRALYTKAAYAGGLVYIEKRVASERTENDGTYGLVMAWDSTLQQELEDEIKDALNAGSLGSVSLTKTVVGAQIALEMLVRKPKYWKLFAAYRLAATYDFTAGTTESSYPRWQGGRPILPSQLTSFLERASDTSTYNRLNARAPVYFEYSTNATTDSDGTWVLPNAQSDNFEIDADGTIWLRGLRSLRLTYQVPTVTLSGSTVTDVTINVNAIRCNIAIPCDHRLQYGYKLAVDETASLQSIDDLNSDNDRIDSSLSRLYYADSAQLYAHEIRTSGSWPTPASVDASNDYSAATLRDDTDYLQAALERRLRDIGRVARHGRLVVQHLAFFRPGDAIKELSNTTGSAFPIRGIVQAMTFHASDGVNFTEIELS